MYNLLDTPVVEILLSNGIIRQYNYIVGVVYLSGYGNILRYAIISSCGSLSCYKAYVESPYEVRGPKGELELQ